MVKRSWLSGMFAKFAAAAIVAMGVVTSAHAQFPENFDTQTPPALPAGWTTTSLAGAGTVWVTNITQANSAANSVAYVVGGVTTATDKVLQIPAVTSSGVVALDFWRFYTLEGTTIMFDGWIVEYSVNAGPWTNVGSAAWSLNGYNGTIAATTNALNGQPAFGFAASAWTNSRAVVTSGVGDSVAFRFRFSTDSSVASTGVWIDDVNVTTSADGACCTPDGMCALLTPAACSGMSGAILSGTTCAPSPCPAIGACCDTASTTCALAFKFTCAAALDFYQGDGTVCGPNPCGTPFSETEDNETKALADANPITFTGAGNYLRGLTTGTSTTVGGGAGTVDTFRIKTPDAPDGIYRHRLTLFTNGTAGHTGSIRGLNQPTFTAGTWPGAVGTPGTTDSAVQSSSTSTTPARFNQWYGFGKQEEIYYRVTGGTATTSDYYAVYSSEPVTPTSLGSFVSGQITITTVGQGHTTGTDLWVYDSNFNAIDGYGNEDASINGGHTANLTALSFLRRTYVPGTYYLAISNINLSNNKGAPCDDNTRTGLLMDFPDVVVNSSTTTAVNVSFAITDATATTPIAATRADAYEVLWYSFTVAPAANPTGEGSATPNPVAQGGSTTLNVAVTPSPGGTLNDISSVVVDVSMLTGNASPDNLALTRDGVTANWISGPVSVNIATTPGSHLLPFTITQATPAAVGTGNINVNVQVLGDTCGLAVPITPGMEIVGNNASAGNDTGLPTCNALSTFNLGMWYTFTAATNNAFEATTCSGSTDFNTRVYVYTGTCGSLVCANANALASPACGVRSDAASTKWCATSGTTYYILVTNDTTGSGNFGLTVTDLGFTCPGNDACENATILSPGVPVSTFNTFATNESPTPPTCNGFSTFNLGLWFAFTPASNNLFSATTCNPATTLNTRVYVYTGSCGAFTCVSANSTASPACASPANAATVNFCATSGTTYYILVTNDTTGTGDFTVEVQDLGAGPCLPPPNDTCATAEPIPSLPYSDSTDVGNAGDDDDVTCNTAAAGTTRAGIWYSYTPASTCILEVGDSGGQDVVYGLFTGSCAGLTPVACLTTNERSYFRVEAGVPYYILVGRFADTPSPAGAVYNLTFNCSAPAANDLCSGATAITSLPFNATETLTGLGVDDQDGSCSSATLFGTPSGAWYTYTPATSCFVQLAETGGTDAIWQVFTGACGGLSEVACDVDDTSSPFISLTGGITYTFLLGHNSTTAAAVGATWIVAIDCFGPAPNDTCSTATVISSLPFTNITNPATLTDDAEDGSCSSASVFGTPAGMWFSYTPGSNCSISLSETGTSDAIWLIYTGACGAQTEFACDVDDTINPLVNLTGGTTYYFLVGGNSTTAPSASWNVTIDCIPPAPNDTCSTATVISSLPFTNIANPATLTDDAEDGSCSSTSVTGTPAGMWFTYTPGSDCLISLSETGSSDAIWLVYTGTCGSQAEFACDVDDTASPLINLTGGTTYYFLVGGNSTTAPSAAWNVSINCLQPLTNDSCSSPTVVSTFPYMTTVNTETATDDGIAVSPQGSCDDFITAGEGIDNSVWYRVTPAVNGTIDVNADPLADNALQIMVIFTGTCGAFTETFCSTSDPIPTTFPAVAGTNYYICLGDEGASPDGGTWDLTINFTPDAPVNDFCCRGTTCNAVAAGTCTGVIAGSQSIVRPSCGTGNSFASCCYADFNHDGAQSIDDLFLYFNAYFTGSPMADFGGDGTSQPTIDDLFLYINAYFGTCS